MKSFGKFTLSLLTVFSLATVISCQAPKHEKAYERAEKRLDALENKLDSISEDDAHFGDKLDRELADFENSIEQLGDEMALETDEAALKSKAKIEDIKIQTNAMRNRLNQWTYNASDTIDSIGSEIKENFRELKRTLRRHTQDDKWDDNK